MITEPLISCICISRKGGSTLKNAIKYFCSQTYGNKELIILEKGRHEAGKLAVQQGNDKIKVFEYSPRTLENLKPGAFGEYLTLWSETDWHHCKRLETQMNGLTQHGKDASVLPYFLIYDFCNNRGFFSLPVMNARSILCKKEVYCDNVGDLSEIEFDGNPFARKLIDIECVFPVISPYLYACILDDPKEMGSHYTESLTAASYRLPDKAAGILRDTLCNVCNETYTPEMASDILSDLMLVGQLDYWRYMKTGVEQKNERHESLVKQLEGKIVLNGPFKGLKYPELKSIGSAIFPKLVGSYEAELHPILKTVIDQGYTCVFNIGCGEGYYAVGLAITLSNAVIYAFDIEQEARDLCSRMSLLNGVAGRVIVGQACTADLLGEFEFPQRSLIVCDCEGYESVLFNKHTLPNLENCDLLIETHDFIDINISTTLVDLFRETHHLTIVKSVDDIEKAKNYCYHPYEQVTDLIEKKSIYGEGRPTIMEWLWLTTKK